QEYAKKLQEYATQLKKYNETGTGNAPLPPEPPKNQDEDRKYITFLISCLGKFSLPVGVPLLNELAVKEGGTDKEVAELRQRNAVWALANVGDNLRCFDMLSGEKRDQIVSELELADDGTERGQTARTSLDYLKARSAGTPNDLSVDKTFEKC